MHNLSLEPTAKCSQRCKHCMRAFSEDTEISFDLLKKIIKEAKELGITEVSLTGGEATLYSRFEEMLEFFADEDMYFNLITNAFKFKEKTLPLILIKRIRRLFTGLCFSIDSPYAQRHDKIREKGSFSRLIEAANLAKMKGINFSIKCLLSSLNIEEDELKDMVFLADSLGAESLSFLYPFVTPGLIEEGLMPSPDKLQLAADYILSVLAKAFKIPVYLEGYGIERGILFKCNAFDTFNIDYKGNFVFCCNLSAVYSQEYLEGREVIGNLAKMSLKEAISRHYRLLADFISQRLSQKISGNEINPCFWCFRQFGKLSWLKKYPKSPWAKGII